MNSPLTTSAAPVLILEGCALAMLRTLPDASVDAIVTSPPYWGLRDYGIEPTDWPACSYAPMPGLPAIEVPAERSCLGLEPTLHAFLAHLVLIFEECRRVLKPTGSAWVNMGDGYSAWVNMGDGYSAGGRNSRDADDKLPERGLAPRPQDDLKPKDLMGQPWRVAFALQAAGWYLRQDNIWHKPNPMPESIRDRATKAHEYVFHLTKSERYFFDLEAWSEKASEHTNPRRAGNGETPRPAGWASGKDHSAVGWNKGERLKSIPQHDGKVKNNASMDAALAVMPLTRNKRSVWTVPTVAYSEAHYATYPPRLITPPILASTSAKGCCSQCGKPWERVVKKTDVVNPAHKGSRFDAGKTSERPAHGMDTVQKGERYLKQPTDHWQPTCQCQPGTENGELRTSIVLDPFGGSGTTAQVALEHGRHAILIERGPHNVALIHKRLAPVLAAPVLHLV
jgi:DNA modification methylase